MKETYLSPEFREVRERYIALEVKLNETHGVENKNPIAKNKIALLCSLRKGAVCVIGGSALFITNCDSAAW